MEHLQFQLKNVHCEECEVTVRQIFSKFFDIVLEDTNNIPAGHAIYKQINSQVDVYYRSKAEIDEFIKDSLKKIVRQLKKAGFEVLSWEYSEDDQLIMDSIQEPGQNGKQHHGRLEDVNEYFPSIVNWYNSKKEKKFTAEHLKNCKKCQLDMEQKKHDNRSDESIETVVDTSSQEFRAVFYVGGMTCASCVQSVSDTISDVLTDIGVNQKEDEANYSVNLVQHSAVVIVPNKQVINRVVNAILDTGFECKVLEVLPVERSINVKITAAIGGITCSACANSIESAVHELPFVLDCSINTVTKTGIFVMDGSDTNVDALKTTVEDCGFDFEVLATKKINFASGKKQSRSINLSISGMFCMHCPELIHEYLTSFGEAVVIEDPITLKHPFVKFTYIPDSKINLNLRRIIKDLNHIQPTDGPDGFKIDLTQPGKFQCELVVPVSMDEHLRRLARKEVMKIVRRLVIATVFAIPTFVFGVVAMSLLPKHNPFRMWTDEPLWVGNASRNSWVLLILSTPVYFFAADVFHRKALVEIKSLWVHKNSFKKRLFKFGSMNLLMFLGTTIAYVASIVLLILSTRQPAMEHMAFHTTYFDSVVFLTFFLLIGRLLESISKSKTADAVSSLSNLKTTSATLVQRVMIDKKGSALEETETEDTEEEEEEEEDEYRYSGDSVIDVKFLEVGDYIRIATGESPPVDCVIVENVGEFDESAITGESTPVKHYPGHQIFSGTVNISNQSIIAKILSLESESLIDQILSTVREGQLRKAPIERVADTITGYFVPIIVLIGILVFVIWISLSYGGALQDSYLDIDIGGWFMWSLEFSIAVFVIACPCGIGLAAPTALFVGSGLAAKHGILAKGGGSAFQDGASTKVVCFDKTGTLTYGELKVTDYAFNTTSSFLKSVGLQVARDLELSSKHPLANAVKAFVNDLKDVHDISNNKVPNVETVPGKGLRGEIIVDSEATDDWKQLHSSKVILGNESLFIDCGVELTDTQATTLTQWKQERKSVILVGLQSQGIFGDESYHLLLMLGLRDQIRSETKSIIKYLQDQLHIECWMITGDNSVTANAIASEIGISSDNVVSEVLPADKQAKVKAIKDSKPGNVVAMVGDGINDAPALAIADIGIALASGADLAVTSSDFILLNKQHPLSTLVILFDLSKKVFRRVKFNFCWALVYNMIGIPIAAGIIYPINNSRLGPVWASAAMAASSVSVVLSSLALNWYKPKMKVEEFNDKLDEEVKETVIS